MASGVSITLPAMLMTGASAGFSKNAMGEPPTKMRFAARDTISSELRVNNSAISRRLAPELK